MMALPVGAHAIQSSGLVDGLWFSQDVIVDSKSTIVYAVLHNQTTQPLDGLATLVVDGSATQVSDVRVGAGDIKRVAIAHQFATGVHTVAITFTPRNGADVATAELARKTIVALRDTDGDGQSDKSDSDDDNDGILDTVDSKPLVAAEKKESTQGASALLHKLVGSSSTKNTVANTGTTTATSTDSGVVALLADIEAWRQQSAAELDAAKAAHQETLTELRARQERASNVDGFEPSVQEQSDIREAQIASAGAATLGWMFNKKFVFYAEVVVLLLGVVHLLWIWLKYLLRTKDEEEFADEEEWEEE